MIPLGTPISEHQGLCPCHPALAAEGSGARAEELPHTPRLRLSGGEAFKGALRLCFRSPERWSRSDEPGARPLTGIGSVRAGPLEDTERVTCRRGR